MASGDIESQKTEIEALTSKYGQSCRVIADVGEFTHIVTVKMTANKTTIKFQLDGSYPKSPPQIIVMSPTMHESTINDLTNHLAEECQRLANKENGLLDHLLTAASEWLDNSQVTMVTDAAPGFVNKKKGKPKGKKKGNSRAAEEDESRKKKPSMKTATDVISRILWDKSLEKDDFIVGYIDRFRGLLERSFADFSWEDIASVDYDVLAIPKHRIQYFKYKDVKVWDKLARVDHVFGSSGKKKLTIQDVIERYQEICAEQNPEADTNEVKPGDENLGEDDSDSDSDDGIVVNVGDEVGEIDSDDYSSEPWGNKLRPNYFIAVRLTDPEILGMVGHIQDICSEREPRYQECCIGPNALHITLCTLRIDSHEQMDNVQRSLREAAEDLKTSAAGIKLKLEGIDNFFHRVLYAKVHHGDDFKEFVHELKLVLRTGGIEIRDNYDFVPHMTLMKVSRPVARAMGTKLISPHIYHGSHDILFGEQVIDGIHLCSMKEEKGADGFYACPLSLKF